MAFPIDEPLDAAALPALSVLREGLGRVDRCLTSPLLRARQTAAALAQDVTVEPALRELDLGQWRGRALRDIHDREPEAAALWLSAPDAVPHGGESRAQLQARVGAWLNAQMAGRGHTLCVTHAAVIRAAVLHTLGSPPDAFWRLDIEPLSRTALRCDGRRWALRGLNAPPS
ncbi:histidine phosphatase family protein [Xanthobacter variabilis]|uniref:histidine phosphatase family protein n=1 Tax=Xanthobacter variabilis TaxID=3119932 RepID=UPI00374EF66E